MLCRFAERSRVAVRAGGWFDLHCCQQNDGRSSLITWSSLSEIVSIDSAFEGIALRTFELALAQRWSVACNDDELGFARTESLEGRFVAECDCFLMKISKKASIIQDMGGWVPLPDFITSANLELMLSAVFLDFLTGAIVALLNLSGTC